MPPAQQRTTPQRPYCGSAYRQPAGDQPGFLARPAAAPRRPVNQQALQSLVAQRWQDFAADRASTTAADRLRRLALLRRGLAGFAGAVRAARTQYRAAAVQHQKRLYMRLGSAWAAWRARAVRRRWLEEKVAEADRLRSCLLAERGWQAWRRAAAARRARRHARTRAACYHAFCTMAKAMDAWRSWLRVRHAKARGAELAAAHTVRTVRCRALRAWRGWARQRQIQRHQLELADSFDRLRLLSWAWAALRALAAALRGRREEAATRIRHALFGEDRGLLALAVAGWRGYVARQGQLRDCWFVAQRLHRFNVLHRCWQGWLHHLAWQRHLRQLYAGLSALQPRLLLHFAWLAWTEAVEASLADDGHAYHRALQLPRAFASWRRVAAWAADLSGRAELGRANHARAVLHGSLGAWRRWASSRAARAARAEQAEAWGVRRRHRVALAAWRSWAGGKRAQQAREEQAVAHHARRRLQLLLEYWRQQARLRRLSYCWYEHRMQREVLARWRRHTRYKQDKAARRRRAVRHRYLRLLQLVLAGWRAYHTLQQLKHQNAKALASHYQRQLVRRALSAWSGPFLQAARLQRDRMTAAGAQYRRGLMQASLRAWRGPFLAAARAQRQADQRAITFWRANVLHAAFAAWWAFLAGRQAKRARLAELQRALQPGRRRRALSAWRLVQQALAELRAKAKKAERAYAWALQRTALHSWTAFYAARTAKRQQWLAALMFRSRQRLRQALLHWRDAAHTATAVRRAVGVETDGLPDVEQLQQEQLPAPAGPRCGAASSLDSLLGKLGQLKALAAQQLQRQQEPAPLQARQHCTNFRPPGAAGADAALRSQPGQRPAPTQQLGSSAGSTLLDAVMHAAAAPCSPSGASGSRYTVAAQPAAGAPRLVALPGDRAPMSTQQGRQVSVAQCAPSGAPAPAGSACGGVTTAGGSPVYSTSSLAGSCAWRLLQLRRPQERPQPRRLLATAAVQAGAAAGREGGGPPPAAG